MPPSFAPVRQTAKSIQSPSRLGGATFNPVEGEPHTQIELHSQDHVTITHSNPAELARILEVVKLMGASVGTANAGGSP